MRLIDRRSLLLTLGAVANGAVPAWAQLDSASDLRSFGARGDGVSDDTGALQRALASGVPLDGRGLTYGVRGSLGADVDFRGLRRCTIRQLQNDDHLQTLVINHASTFTLSDVEVIRGGQNDDALIQRDMQLNAGIRIEDCTGFRLDKVRVSGGGIGTGLVIVQSQGFTVTDARVCNIHYRLHARPTDDMLQGIWINRSSGFDLVRPVVFDLGGQDDQGFSRDNNRAIAISGSRNFQVHDLDVSQCGQGLDVTGAKGNFDFQIIGGHAADCFSWGFKFANSAERARLTGALAERCGLGGFVVGGRSKLADPPPEDIEIADCRAVDCGAQGSPHTTFGFGVLRNRPDPDYPRKVHFVRCVAIDQRNPPGMKWGFFCDMPTPPDQRNTVQQCTSQGAAVADFKGFDEQAAPA